jgi:hypothetical protein
VTLDDIRTAWTADMISGAWTPPVGDPLHSCEFVRVGFRAYGLEAPDHSWRLTLTRLDFGASSPTALLEVHAPNHAAAFGDLGDFVFSHSVGVNGGTNFSQCIKRLYTTLGGTEKDWDRRLTYLIARARQANAGMGNGTFSTMDRPMVAQPPPFVFAKRIREGRTMSLFGPGGGGKTTIVSGLVVSSCSGKEIIPNWAPSRRYTVLVLDWDEGREEEEVRLAAICNAYDVKLEGGYHYKRMSRPLADIADEVGAYVVANKIDLVVVSPVGRATRDHGDNITAPIDELYEILRTFGSTNILIDHVTGQNSKGGADREYGSVRKRDNARGSYSLYPQSEDIGERVVVLRNTKADALAPRMQPQAIRIVYDPPESDDGIYATIRFLPDEVVEGATLTVMSEASGNRPLREAIRDTLVAGHLSVTDIAAEIGAKRPSVERVLYRYSGTWFSRLPSGRWELLPAGRNP